MHKQAVLFCFVLFFTPSAPALVFDNFGLCLRLVPFEAAVVEIFPLFPRCTPDPLFLLTLLRHDMYAVTPCGTVLPQVTKYHKDIETAYRPFLSLLGTGIVTSDGKKWRRQRNKVDHLIFLYH